MKISARFPGLCPICGQPYKRDETILWDKRFGVESCLQCHHKGAPKTMERMYPHCLHCGGGHMDQDCPDDSA